MNKKDLIQIRTFEKADQDFIEATFLQSLYHLNDFFHRIDEQIYYQNYRKIVQGLLRLPLQMKIACLRDSPEIIIAYSLMDKDVLHYVFCKHDWRGIGLMNDLVEEVKEVTHLTRPFQSILRKKFPNALFNPFAIGGRDV